MEKRIDLLDRQEFVDRMLNVTELLAKRKKNVCYAVNGGWGVGKSFVLDMFEEQAAQKLRNSKGLYMVFRYNCWEYDYYEEPLIAIVAAILDQIDKNSTIPQEKKEKVKGVLRVIGRGLAKKAINWIEEKTGAELEEVVAIIKDGCAEGKEKWEEDHSFDSYFEFKKILASLSDTIAVLSKEQTLIFIVDELDRCLPEYTIKVLERLHHVFDDVENVQVVLAIDKEQLGHVIRQIYGEKTSIEKYLAKFIDFEMKLETGSMNYEVDRKFEEYFSHFEYSYHRTREGDVAEFKKMVWEGIDIRGKLAIADNCLMLHELMASDSEKKDYAYMCIEMFLTVVKFYKIDTQTLKGRFSINSVFSVQDGNARYAALYFLTNKFRNEEAYGEKYYVTLENRHYINNRDIWGILLAVYRLILEIKNDAYQYREQEFYQMLTYGEECWKLLQNINFC